jgi:hypothetical protein
MKRIAVLGLSALLAAAGLSSGQERSASGQVAVEQTLQISRGLAFREITLYLRDGAAVWGRLVGAGIEAVRIRQAGKDLDVPFRDIRRAVVKRENNALASKGLVPGMALGLYIGNGLLSGAFSRPGFYLERGGVESSGGAGVLVALAVIESFFAAAGGALGWLAGSGARQKSFEFPGDPEAGLASWEEFVRYVGGEPAPPRVHLLIQGGPVDTRVSQGLEEGLAGTGLSPSMYPGYVSNFSYLRAFHLTYSVKPRLQAGLRISFPSEPGRRADSEYDPNYYSSLWQEYLATAFHAVVSIEPVPRKAAAPLSWNVGLGVGLVAIRLLRRTTYYGPEGWVESVAEVAETLPSGVVFSTLEFRLTQVFHIGIAADYTLIPAAEAPAMADFGIPSLKVSLCNASAGFVLGFHF